MVPIDTNIARELLEHRVSSRLGHALDRHREHGQPMSWASVQWVSHEAISAVFDHKESLEMLLQVYLSEHPESIERFLVRNEADEWLRTEQVAKLLGFSAPYVRALLDNELFFRGKVRRSEGGQRSVSRAHVEEWRRLRGVPTPEERRALPDDERETPDLDVTQTAAPELAARRKARAQARELRRKAAAGE
jgi:transglutaminase-like putative cysteine protease